MRPPFGLALLRRHGDSPKTVGDVDREAAWQLATVLGVRRTSHDLKAPIGPILDNNLATVTTLNYQRALHPAQIGTLRYLDGAMYLRPQMHYLDVADSSQSARLNARSREPLWLLLVVTVSRFHPSVKAGRSR